MTRIAGSTVLVTGASSGVGRAVALRCGAAGARLVLVGRDERRLAETAASAGGTTISADLAMPGAVDSVADRAGPVDVLVCNAGSGLAGDFADTDPDSIDRLIKVNLTSTIDLVRAVLPPMRTAGRGHIVVVSSVAGRLPARSEAVYGATKAAVDHFAAALRMELAVAGVGVSTIAPAGVDTAFFDRRGVPYGRGIPRMLTPDRVAGAVVKAIERDLPEVVLPGWLRLAYLVRAAAPRMYDGLSRRFG